MKHIIATVIGLSLFLFSFAQDVQSKTWTYVGKAADGIVWYFEPKVISKDNSGYFTVWIKIYNATIRIGDQNVKGFTEYYLWKVDCNNREYKEEDYILIYNETRNDVSDSFKSRIKNAKWNNPGSGKADGVVLSAICKKLSY